MGWWGLSLTHADSVLPDEASWAPGPAHAAQGSGARSEGDPGMVGAIGDGGAGPQPRHQRAPVADSGHIWSSLLQRGTGLAISEEGVAGRAQTAVAALEVVALVGAGPGQLQALINIWKEQGPGGMSRARCSWPAFPRIQLPHPLHAGLPPSLPSPGTPQPPLPLQPLLLKEASPPPPTQLRASSKTSTVP